MRSVILYAIHEHIDGIHMLYLTKIDVATAKVVLILTLYVGKMTK